MTFTIGNKLAYKPVEQRFWAKVDRRGPAECWPWNGSRFGKGYGQFWRDGAVARAHRVAYELMVGPIPEGKVIDHLCKNPSCVNPAHMEPVTAVENVMRGESPGARNARKTHCPAGHPYSPENTVKFRTSGRQCRACKAEKWRSS